MSLREAVREKVTYSANEIIFSDSEYIHENMLVGRPGTHHWKEVTQLAAVKWDLRSGKSVDTFSEFVRPKRTPDIAEECWKQHQLITGLDTKAIQQAKPFPEVYARYINFCSQLPIVVFDRDWHVHSASMKEHGIALDTSHYRILKPVLVSIDKKYESICSGELYREIGLAQEEVLPHGSTHNALFDSMSMALFVGRTVLL